MLARPLCFGLTRSTHTLRLNCWLHPPADIDPIHPLKAIPSCLLERGRWNWMKVKGDKSIISVSRFCSTAQKPKNDFVLHRAYCYRGADKSLTLPWKKQDNVSVRMVWISFGALLCGGWGGGGNLMTVRVSMLLKSRASLTCFRACFLPDRAKDLSVLLTISTIHSCETCFFRPKHIILITSIINDKII
jgi:hypothetical protein